MKCDAMELKWEKKNAGEEEEKKNNFHEIRITEKP